MTTLAKVVFAVLVAAAFGAFFVAQELKSSPSVVQSFKLRHRVISPNGDGRFDRQRVTFRLKRADTVDVAVVDHKGDVVRELASGRRLGAYRQLLPSLPWDGTDASGRRVPDGLYRIRITLRDQGRTIVVPRAFRVDRRPPTVEITSIGPDPGRGPELLPNRADEPARIRLNAPSRNGRLVIFRTWPAPAVQVAELQIPNGDSVVTWDGRGADGQLLAQGTYLAVAEVRDRAGNIGTSVPVNARGLPEPAYGRALPGRGGITIRRVAVQPPLVAVPAGSRGTFGVGGRRQPYTWSLRRVGGRVIRSGSANRPLVSIKAPGKTSGVYLFRARRDGVEATAPMAVDDAARHRVLVVLPVMTWQGRNPVDDDGDGEPNLLTTGQDVRLTRVFGTPQVPGFPRVEEPTLLWLDRERHRYDVTTDVALAAGTGPKLAGHSGVLVAGDAVWLPADVQRRLRGFVTAGGTLVSMGVESYQRQAVLTPRLRLTNPTPRATTDLFGSTVSAVQPGVFDLTNETDEIGLFVGTRGVFGGFTSAEVTRSTGRQPLEASAVDGKGQVVIAAVKVGRGTAIRFGLPQLPGRVSTDPEVLGLVESAWDLLSR